MFVAGVDGRMNGSLLPSATRAIVDITTCVAISVVTSVATSVAVGQISNWPTSANDHDGCRAVVLSWHRVAPTSYATRTNGGIETAGTGAAPLA
eukprot:CAMPEP_0198134614 /NCGR_PEP_ID=MMETSP1442-20131203/60166_1 /TAXON_ID= /ORGANISM="Craspedostauros australis, Strain CCMP3328" /LENGTH=93 /DNA_ID=CAMNT_0043795759 /DNA_START=1112 /DNA_END=1393 /DNA_ORIENTATION=+